MTAHVYLWRDLRFELPQGFDDDSVLTFSHAGVVSLTVTKDSLTGTVEAYARAQEQAFAQTKQKNYKADAPKAEAGAVVVDRAFDDASGFVVQRQAFKQGGKGVVVVVTGTARAAHADKAKKAVVDVVQSLKVGAS